MDNAVKATMEALGAYLKLAMPKLTSVLYDFPNANVKLSYPALSIISGEPTYTNHMPYLLSQDDVASGEHKAKARYIVGQYDFKLQLDFWCGNKEERFKVYQEFFQVFNPDMDVMGLSLQLTKNFGTWARYDLVGHNFSDGEEVSQRAEWRARVSVLATCKAVLDKTRFIITEPIENNLDPTHNEIVEP